MVGWLVGFSDFQRNIRFGSNMAACRSFFLVCVVDSKAAIHNCPSRVFYTSIPYFISQLTKKRRINSSFMFQEHINYEEREMRKNLAVEENHVTLRSIICRVEFVPAIDGR